MSNVNYKAAHADERRAAEETAEAAMAGAHPGARTAAGNGPHIQNLVGEALRESSDLARKEFSLFKAEMAESVKSLFLGIAMMMGAAVFAIGAIILLTEALVKWLATVVNSEALAALIVGGVLAAIAIGLGLYGKSAFSSFSLTPERTMRSIKRDTRVISERVS
jgi:putative superfamily III holin-X